MTISSIKPSPYLTPLAAGLKAPDNPGKPAPISMLGGGEVPYIIAKNGTYQQTAAYKAAAKLPTTNANALGKQVTDQSLVDARNAAIAKAKADGANDPKVVKPYNYKPNTLNGTITGTNPAINSSITQAKNLSSSAGTPSDPLAVGAEINPLVADAKMIAKANDIVSLNQILKDDNANKIKFTQYQIALRDSATGGAANGKILFNGQPAIDASGKAITGVTYVGGVYTINALDLGSLSYQVGALGTADDLLVAGVSIPSTNGIGTQYSTPLGLQIKSGSYRSLNGAAAVSNGTVNDSDPTLDLAQSAAIHSPKLGVGRPAMTGEGNLTVAGGDTIQLSRLVKASVPDKSVGGQITAYNVALGGTDGNAQGVIRLNGKVLLNSQMRNLTPEQFSQLTYTANSTTTTPPPTGFITISAEFSNISSLGTTVKVLSNPLQISVAATGVTSPNALPALLSTAASVDAFANLSNNVLPSGTATLSPPRILSDLASGEAIHLSSAINPKPATAGDVKAYQIALSGDVGLPNSGYLMLDDAKTNLLNDPAVYNPATGIYTIDEADWSKLQFVSGGQGTQTSIAVTALYVPSGAAANAPPVYSDIEKLETSVENIDGVDAGDRVGANGYVNLAFSAQLYRATAAKPAPTLTNNGDITSAQGDVIGLNKLVQANSGSDKRAVTKYQIALNNASGGTASGYLSLDGKVSLQKDPNNPNAYNAATGVYTISADQLLLLTYISGATGTSDTLSISAIADSTDVSQFPVNVAYSPVTSFTNSVTGVRSLNLAGAVSNDINGIKDNASAVANDARIFRPIGKQVAPAITDQPGNFSVASGDKVSLGFLISSQGGKGSDGSALPVVGYNIALRNAADGSTATTGKLYLMQNGVLVAVPASQTYFSNEDLPNLVYQTDANARAGTDQLVIDAVAGQLTTGGLIINRINSQAVAFNVTTAPNGPRSLNVTGAVTTVSDDNIFGLAVSSSIYSGFGRATPPVISTDIGNFTLGGNQTVNLGDLYSASPSKNSTATDINKYKVAIGGTGSQGSLYLYGVAVAGADLDPTKIAKTEFTALEFSLLTYQSGAVGSSDTLIVSAIASGLDAVFPVWSPALEINANVTGKISLNVAGKILGNGTGTAAITTKISGYEHLVQTAALYRTPRGGTPLNLLTNLQGDFADGGVVTSLSPISAVPAGAKTVLIPGSNVSVGNLVSYPGIGLSQTPGINPAATQPITVTQVTPTQIVTLNTTLTVVQMGELLATNAVKINNVGSGLVTLNLNSVANSTQIFVNPDAAVKPGDVILDSVGNIIGTVTTVQAAQSVTVSSPFINGIGAMDKMIFSDWSLSSNSGNAVGQYSSTAPIDRSNFKNFSQSAVAGQNGYNTISNFAAPGTQATRTALYLLNSSGLGGYQISDANGIKNRYLSVG
ncbi:MAG: hypothetical protein ORN98_07675 [Alphaproteobacteria bacterium]|nr:hypothetical protein [Alphaproteobacteria bacterium]